MPTLVLIAISVAILGYSNIGGLNMFNWLQPRVASAQQYPTPKPTAAPTTRGATSYLPMSSQTNPMASNYQSNSSGNSSQLNAFGASLYKTNPYQTTNRLVNTNPLTGDFIPTDDTTTSTGGENSGGTNAGGSNIDALIELAKQRYNALMENANRNYGSAMDYVSKGLGRLGEKRAQFQDLFSQGQGDIAQGYSKEAGSAARTAEAQRTTAANSARAMGTGGSYLQGLTNRVNDALARTLASVGQSRSQNERENRGLLNERTDWATGQEDALNLYGKQAQDALTAAQGVNATDYADNLIGLQDRIANIMATVGAKPSTDGYGAYGSSKAGVDFGNIQNILANLNLGMGQGQAQQTDGASSVVSPTNIFDLLRRRTN